MILPVKGKSWVSSPYGERTLKGIKQLHDGIDFVGGFDNAVVAVADGIVEFDKDDYDEATRWTDKHMSGGNMVIIQHKIDGLIYYARYLHLVQNFIAKTDVVKEGQIIGTYGDVGFSFGAHLHFDIYSSLWKKLDPTPFFTGLI